MKPIFALTLLVFCFEFAQAQQPDIFNQIGSRVKGIGSSGSGGRDTIGFEHRNDKKDSIGIYYKYLDSIRSIPFDSTINDFDKYFSIPSSYIYLGNNGAAAYPIVYQPNAKPGWDAGFHAYDAYRYTLEGTKIYKTNRPFSQLSYQLASGKEQMIKILHTQNPRPNWSFGFDYRLISAPGFFTNQNTNNKS
ncbi:MAG: putative porin, partial [Ginsengibacter sp.]